MSETSDGLSSRKWEKGLGQDFRWFVKRKVVGEGGVWARLEVVCPCAISGPPLDEISALKLCSSHCTELHCT